MASFSSLPQELVDHIVELATPTFGAEDWQDRSRMLKALCLTSKALLEPARRLLCREIGIKSATSLSTLLRRLESPAFERRLGRLVVLCVEHSWSTTPDWPDAVHDDACRQVLSLIKKFRPPLLALRDFYVTTDDYLEHVKSLLLDNCIFHGPAPLHTFHALRRITLCDSEVTFPATTFTSAAFPSLVTVALRDSCTDWPHRHVGSADIIILDNVYFPLLPQLHAASINSTGLDFLTGPSSLVVLSTSFTSETVECAANFPTTLKVLRLDLDPSEMDDIEDADAVVSLLSSPSFTPTLKELHLASTAHDHPKFIHAVRGCAEWCALKDVKLLVRGASSVEEPFDPSFWRFLNDLKDRLGLDV